MRATLITKAERDTLRANWRELHAARKLTAEDLALYAILRGRNPEKGFAFPRGLSYSPRYFPTLEALRSFETTWPKLLRLLPGTGAERQGELFRATADAINRHLNSK